MSKTELNAVQIEQLIKDNIALKIALSIADEQKSIYRVVTDSEKHSEKHITLRRKSIVSAILKNDDFQKDFNIVNNIETQTLICDNSMNALLITAITKAISDYKTSE